MMDLVIDYLKTKETENFSHIPDDKLYTVEEMVQLTSMSEEELDYILSEGYMMYKDRLGGKPENNRDKVFKGKYIKMYYAKKKYYLTLKELGEILGKKEPYTRDEVKEDGFSTQYRYGISMVNLFDLRYEVENVYYSERASEILGVSVKSMEYEYREKYGKRDSYEIKYKGYNKEKIDNLKFMKDNLVPISDLYEFLPLRHDILNTVVYELNTYILFGARCIKKDDYNRVVQLEKDRQQEIFIRNLIFGNFDILGEIEYRKKTYEGLTFESDYMYSIEDVKKFFNLDSEVLYSYFRPLGYKPKKFSVITEISGSILNKVLYFFINNLTLIDMETNMGLQKIYFRSYIQQNFDEEYLKKYLFDMTLIEKMFKDTKEIIGLQDLIEYTGFNDANLRTHLEKSRIKRAPVKYSNYKVYYKSEVKAYFDNLYRYRRSNEIATFTGIPILRIEKKALREKVAKRDGIGSIVILDKDIKKVVHLGTYNSEKRSRLKTDK